MRKLCTAIFLAVTLVGSGYAQDSTWVGKSIIIKKAGVKIGHSDKDGKQVYLAELTDFNYRVVAEQDGWLRVNVPKGITGWFDKADAVLVPDAVAYFTEQIKKNPQDASAYARRGVTERLTGKLDQAVADLSEAIKLSPHPLHHHQRAAALHAKKEYDKAIADYTEAIRLEPKMARSLRGRAAVFHAKKEHDKAIADYTEALRLNPKFAGALSGRGVTWHAKKEYDKAIADFDAALAISKKSSFAYAGRGNSWLAKKNYDKAIADYNEAIRINSKSTFAHSGRGSAYLAKKEYDKAIVDFSLSLKSDPDSALTLRSRGAAYQAKKDYPKAISDFKEAIRLQPKDTASLSRLGEVQFLSKQYNEALANWQKALKINPNHAWATMHMAEYLATTPQEKGRNGKKAVELAKKAMDLEKKPHPQFQQTMAAAYAEAGDFVEAVRWQERALEDPSLKNDAGARRRLELYQKKQPYRQD